MPLAVRTLIASLSCLAAIAGCTSSANKTVTAVVIGVAGAPFERGPRLSEPGALVRSATVEGLVGLDSDGRVIPALADRWIVTDDGLSYIFRLRDGTWSDGSPLTAESAGRALRTAIDRLRNTALGGDLAGLDEVRAMAGRVIELRLSVAKPDLLQLLAQSELGIARNGRGAGPMALRREGNVALLSPIAPEQRGLPAIAGWDGRARPLQLTAQDAREAVARFGAGNADIVLGGTLNDYPLVRDLGLGRGIVQLDPVAGLFGLAVVSGDGFLATPENREAVALAIDRDALAAALGANEWSPSTRIVSPGMEDDPGVSGERWVDLAMAQRRAIAADRVTRWRGGAAIAGNANVAPGAGRPAASPAAGALVAPVAGAGLPEAPLSLRIALPEGPGADLMFARLSADLRAIGIEARRVSANAPADLRLYDAVARYSRATWFLGQLACGRGRGLCSARADELTAAARGAPDAAQRSTLLAQAEAELTSANVFIPLGPPLRWSLRRRSVTGLVANRWGIHPLMALAMVPK